MTNSYPASTGEKRTEGRPQGPPHARKRSAVQTVKRTLTEFREDTCCRKARPA
jgi:hypothetical protein